MSATMKIGDVVSVRRSILLKRGVRGVRRSQEAVKVARIIAFIDDVPGGVVLDIRIDGLCCWNVEDLWLVRSEDPSVAPKFARKIVR